MLFNNQLLAVLYAFSQFECDGVHLYLRHRKLRLNSEAFIWVFSSCWAKSHGQRNVLPCMGWRMLMIWSELPSWFSFFILRKIIERNPFVSRKKWYFWLIGQKKGKKKTTTLLWIVVVFPSASSPWPVSDNMSACRIPQPRFWLSTGWLSGSSPKARGQILV